MLSDNFVPFKIKNLNNMKFTFLLVFAFMLASCSKDKNSTVSSPTPASTTAPAPNPNPPAPNPNPPVPGLTEEEKAIEGKWVVQSILVFQPSTYVTDLNAPMAGELIIDFSKNIYSFKAETEILKKTQYRGDLHTPIKISINRNSAERFKIVRYGNTAMSGLTKDMIMLDFPPKNANQITITYKDPEVVNTLFIIDLKRQ